MSAAASIGLLHTLMYIVFVPGTWYVNVDSVEPVMSFCLHQALASGTYVLEAFGASVASVAAL